MKFINISSVFLVLFLTLSLTIQSQDTKIDSLKTQLQNHKEKDTTRVNLLNELAYSYLNKDSDTVFLNIERSAGIAEAIDYKKGIAKSLHIRGVLEGTESNYRRGFQNYTEALELYKNIDWQEGVAECYKDMGVYMYNNGNQRQAIEYYTKSLEFLDENLKKKEIAFILYELGWSYIEIDNYIKARLYLLKALKINQEIGNENRVSSCLSGVAVTYANQGNYPVALDYYNQTLVVAKKNSNKRRIMLTMGNMGNLYHALKKYDKAIELFNETLSLSDSTDKGIASRTYSNLGLAHKGRKDTELAFEYFKKSQKLYNDVNDKRGESFVLNNIGYIYLETEDYVKAHEYYQRGKQLSIETENQLGLCISYWGLGEIYFHEKKYDEALINALKSKELSVKHNILLRQGEVHELLSNIYKEMGNYKKALKSHQQFKKLNDSLFNKENVEKITQIEYEYKYKQALDSASIRELQLAKTVEAKSLDLEKSQRNYLWAIIGFLLTSIVLGAIIFFQKLRNEKSKTQNIAVEQKLLRSQMTPHFIFNSLSVLQGMILNKEEKKSVYYLSKFSKLLRITLENSRDKLVSLSQELTAVKDYLTLQNLENDAYGYTVLVDETIDIPSLTIPPMLIQPFVENAIEHAFINQKENKQIDIRLTYIDKKLICTITDNGVGVKLETENNRKDKKSLATTITSERLKILSKDLKMEGWVTIEDRQKYNEQGTIATIVIPHKILVE